MSHFDTNEMYPLHFYIFLTFFHIILINTDKIEDDIEFYTKLIESNIQESLKYEQPVNANEYKPNTNEVKGNRLINDNDDFVWLRKKNIIL